MRRVFAALILVALSILPSPIHAQNASQKKQFDALQKFVEGQSPEERVAFNALMVSFSEYRDAHVALESCPSAQPCSGKQRETEHLDADFLALAEQPPPAHTRDDLTNADAQLNSTYDQLFASLPESCPSPTCLSQTSFRNTQRAWIRYRDAWVTFARIRWPEVSPETILTSITRQRTEQLQRISPMH